MHACYQRLVKPFLRRLACLLVASCLFASVLPTASIRFREALSWRFYDSSGEEVSCRWTSRLGDVGLANFQDKTVSRPSPAAAATHPLRS